jgi:hypothetical protein
MKKILTLGLILLTGIILNTSIAFADVYVNGYYKSNGTYVEGYYRSSPDSDPTNNYSYPGNTNPYTGVVAPGNADTYLNNYNKNSSTLSNTEKSIKEAQDKLRKDNEALQKSTEATLLRTKLDSLTNQINQLKQQNSSDSCSSLYYLHNSSPLTCSDSQYQSLLQQKETAKSQVDSSLFKQGLAGNQEIRATRMAEIDAQYDPQITSCKSLQTYNTSSMQEYEQCKANQISSQTKLQELQRQYQETNNTINQKVTNGNINPVSYDQYLKETAEKQKNSVNLQVTSQPQLTFKSEKLGFSIKYPTTWGKTETDSGVSFMIPVDKNQIINVPKLKADIDLVSGTCMFPPVIIKDQGILNVGNKRLDMITMSNTLQGRNYFNRMYTLQNEDLCYIFSFSSVTLDSTETINDTANIVNTADSQFTNMLKTFVFVTNTKNNVDKKIISNSPTPKKDLGIKVVTISTTTPIIAKIATTSEIISSSSTPAQVDKIIERKSVIQRLGGWFSRLFK